MVNESLAKSSSGENRADAVNDVLHRKRRKQNAEQAREHDIAGDAKEPADAVGGIEDDEADRGDGDDDGEQ